MMPDENEESLCLVAFELQEMLESGTVGEVLSSQINVLLIVLNSSHLHGLLSRALGHGYFFSYVLSQ